MSLQSLINLSLICLLADLRSRQWAQIARSRARSKQDARIPCQPMLLLLFFAGFSCGHQRRAAQRLESARVESAARTPRNRLLFSSLLFSSRASPKSARANFRPPDSREQPVRSNKFK